MLRLCSRVGVGAAAASVIGGVLARSIAAPALVRATPVVVPALSNFCSGYTRANLEKYLLLPQEPLGTDVLAWWKKRDRPP